MCDAPARVWDIVGKGRIEVGYDADLVLVDLEREHDDPQRGTSHEMWLEPLAWHASDRLAGANLGHGPDGLQ